jgi:toxin FitB
MTLLLDTSAVIAESAPPDEELAISVITLGELRAGIFLAEDPATRAERNRQFRIAGRMFVAHEVNWRVAERFGEISALARLDNRIKDVADHIIIATAAEHRLTLFTHDKRQGKLAEDLGLLVEYPA